MAPNTAQTYHDDMGAAYGTRPLFAEEKEVTGQVFLNHFVVEINTRLMIATMSWLLVTCGTARLLQAHNAHSKTSADAESHQEGRF